jgi:hypothetical protein
VTPLEIVASYVGVFLTGLFIGVEFWSRRKSRSDPLCPTCLGPTDEDGYWTHSYRTHPTDEEGSS